MRNVWHFTGAVCVSLGEVWVTRQGSIICFYKRCNSSEQSFLLLAHASLCCLSVGRSPVTTDQGQKAAVVKTKWLETRWPLWWGGWGCFILLHISVGKKKKLQRSNALSELSRRRWSRAEDEKGETQKRKDRRKRNEIPPPPPSQWVVNWEGGSLPGDRSESAQQMDCGSVASGQTGRIEKPLNHMKV